MRRVQSVRRVQRRWGEVQRRWGEEVQRRWGEEGTEV